MPPVLEIPEQVIKKVLQASPKKARPSTALPFITPTSKDIKHNRPKSSSGIISRKQHKAYDDTISMKKSSRPITSSKKLSCFTEEQDELKLTLDILNKSELAKPDECLLVGKLMGLEGTPAFSRYRTIGKELNEWEWSSCSAIAFDDLKNMFLIKWPTGNKKWVNRLNLYFAFENRETYFTLIENALMTKNKIFEEYEYETIIKNHKLVGLAELPYFLKLGVLERIGRIITPKELPLIVFNSNTRKK
jgi:hypothetical protein